MRRVSLAQHFSRITDLALTRQKDEDIAGSTTRQFIDGITDRFVQAIFVRLALFARTAFASLPG